jgi:hypothetical protein
MNTHAKAALLSLLLSGAFLNACNTTSEKEKNDTALADSTKSEASSKAIVIDQVANSRAEIFAAKKLADTTGFGRVLAMEATQKHYELFEKDWAQLDSKYLKPLRAWRDSELSEMNQAGNTLFYPFSGPDFLNAYTLFPECDNYVMLGLELVGELPEDFARKDEKYVGKYLTTIRGALEDIFARNYFITSYMSSDLYRLSKGVLPIINVFLARTDNEIVGIHKFEVNKEGKINLKDIKEGVSAKDSSLAGLAIEFKNKSKKRSQWVYYFGIDASDQKLEKKKQEFDSFVRAFPNKVGYLKSASYILFNPNFNIIKNILMEDTQMILQDDTGIRYKDYMASNNWEVQLYGKYAKPVKDFGSYTFQKELLEAYKDSSRVKPLGFPYGYQWRDVNKVSLLLCKRKK